MKEINLNKQGRTFSEKIVPFVSFVMLLVACFTAYVSHETLENGEAQSENATITIRDNHNHDWKKIGIVSPD